MSSSSYSSPSSPRKPFKVKRRPVPDSTVSDLSAYLEQCVQQDSSGSLDSTPSFRKRNLFPDTVHSPTIRMQQILDVVDDQFLRTWFRKNYEKVEGCDFLTVELTCLLQQHVPGIQVSKTYSPKLLIEVLKMFIQDLLFKFEKINIEIGELSGSEFAVKIEDHKRRVVEIINEYERRLAETTEELFQCRAHIMRLDSELTAALSRIQYLEEGEAWSKDLDEVPASQEEFVQELKSRLAANEAYASSLKEEMAKERQKNEMLQLQLGNSKKEQALVEEECMKEIASLSRKSELNSMIEQAMMSMLGISGTDSDLGLKARSPNIEECKTVVKSWLSLMREAIGQNQQEINQIMHEVNLKNEELAQMEFRLEQAQERLEDLEKQERMIREIIRGKEEDVISLDTAAQEMTEYIQQLEQDCELLAQTIEQKQTEIQQMSDFINKLNVAERYDDHAGIYPQQYMDYSASSRDIQAAQPSPYISTPQERQGLITVPGKQKKFRTLPQREKCSI
ncbi:ankycorbin-like [Stegodyphus dumicola]|uniref:ankycorbin-like n=1 Tax=Stegodyphus dumicola TaxID=202533 RepID=UPI0015AB366F|nr:ankycorbin-like [Stegodyphus dumicola]